MSIASSRVSSVSSILKGPGVRLPLIGQSNRVYFKLPQDLKSIIYNFTSGRSTKDYNDLISALDSSNVKESDLIEFLSEARQCLSLLDRSHKCLIVAILRIKWTSKSTDVTAAYKLFVEDLICTQVHHTECVLDILVERFKPDKIDDAEWETGECRKEDIYRLNNIHDVIKRILKVVPLSSKLLLKSIRASFPYLFRGAHTHGIYVRALLQIIEYAPQLRSNILCSLVNRLVAIDVYIPPLDEIEEGDDDMLFEFSREGDGFYTYDMTIDSIDYDKALEAHPLTRTLDVCMEEIFKYMHGVCFFHGVLDVESLGTLYLDFLRAFETVILPTHASQYVQYIMFYICSFKTAIVESFVDWLWQKVSDPNLPTVKRQAAAAYIASLLATASYATPSLVKATQSKLSVWIHAYIVAQDTAECVDDLKKHAVFYTVCQALFLIITAWHRELVDSKDDILYLQNLDLPKIVACKLNPLKVCIPDIAHLLADLTRKYQLAYCYTVIEGNSRSRLPIFQNRSRWITPYENFFPFSTYKLQRSGETIVPLIHNSIISPKRK